MTRTLAFALRADRAPRRGPCRRPGCEPAVDARLAAIATADRIPDQLDATQRDGYRAVFQAIRDGRWQGRAARPRCDEAGPLHAIARAEMFTAKGSPRVELEPLVALLNEAPELPEAESLARLARSRGAVELPPLPQAQRLIWQDGAPRRVRAKTTKSDEIAAQLATQMQPFVKADMGPEAQALLETTQGLTPEAQTEWQAKVAWMYSSPATTPMRGR